MCGCSLHDYGWCAQATKVTELSLTGLPEREKFMATEIYLQGSSVEELAKRLGFHSSRVSQLKKRIIAHVKEKLESDPKLKALFIETLRDAS